LIETGDVAMQVGWQATAAAAGRRAANGKGGDSAASWWHDASGRKTTEASGWSRPCQECAQWVGKSSTVSAESVRQRSDRGMSTVFVTQLFMRSSSSVFVD